MLCYHVFIINHSNKGKTLIRTGFVERSRSQSFNGTEFSSTEVAQEEFSKAIMDWMDLTILRS